MSEKTVSIDGKAYEVDKLSNEARQQLMSLQAADMEIQRLRMRLAMTQTARSAYAQALKTELDKVTT